MSASHRCPRRGCREHGPVELGPTREATVRTVAGAVEHLPIVRCPRGHDDPATDPAETATDVLLRVREAVPHARQRWFRSEVCTSCGAALTMPVRRTNRAVTVADLPDVPVLTYHLDVPLTRCPGCGVDQVPGRSQDDLTELVGELCVAEHRRHGDR